MVTERGRVPGSLTVRAGGWSLILGAVAFMAVFSYLAARFDYPAILDGPAATVLPHLLATGPTGRAVWAIYAQRQEDLKWPTGAAYQVPTVGISGCEGRCGESHVP